jgi:hypothetical protein
MGGVDPFPTSLANAGAPAAANAESNNCFIFWITIPAAVGHFRRGSVAPLPQITAA